MIPKNRRLFWECLPANEYSDDLSISFEHLPDE